MPLPFSESFEGSLPPLAEPWPLHLPDLHPQSLNSLALSLTFTVRRLWPLCSVQVSQVPRGQQFPHVLPKRERRPFLAVPSLARFLAQRLSGVKPGSNCHLVQQAHVHRPEQLAPCSLGWLRAQAGNQWAWVQILPPPPSRLTYMSLREDMTRG